MDSFCLRCGKFIENHGGICKDCQNIVTLFKIPFLDNTSNKFYNIKSESKCRSSRYMQVLPYWLELSQIGRLSDNKIIELVHANGFDKDGLSLEAVKEDIAYLEANSKGKSSDKGNVCNVADLQTWDVIYLGNDWYGNMSWLVLSKKGNRVELIALDHQETVYYDRIRERLQDQFSPINFEYQEKDKFRIKYVRLPIIEEIHIVNKYLNINLFCDCWIQDNLLRYKYIDNYGYLMDRIHIIGFKKAKLYSVLEMDICGDVAVKYRGSLKDVYEKNKLEFT